MVYTSLTVGGFTFTGNKTTDQIRVRFIYPAQVGKLLGKDRSILSDWRGYGANLWEWTGTLTGASGKTNLWALKDEMNRDYPPSMNCDVLGSTTVYGRLISIEPTDMTTDINQGYVYRFRCGFLEIMRDDVGSRGLTWGPVDEDDTFTLTGDRVVCAPVGASSPSATVDFTRVVKSGAATYDVSCFLSTLAAPDPSSITYTVTDANLQLGNVTLARDTTHTNEYVLDNGAVKVQTRHGEATNKGYIELWYQYNNAWVDLGRLRFYIQKTGGAALRELTASTVPPEVWPIWSGNRERQILRLKYPPESSDSIEGTLMLEMQRGRPWVKATAEMTSPTTTTVTGIKVDYHLDLTPTTFVYMTRAGTERDAGAAAYGTETTAGDADVTNVMWVQTTTGAPAAASILAGFARKKQADCDHVGDDAGAYWDYISEQFDNVTISQGYSFEPVWIFAGRYDQIGSRTAANIASEVLVRITEHQGLIPKV